MFRHLSPIAVAAWLVLHSCTASALTVGQFSAICESAPGDCSDHPVLQAYVGGGLDLLATLDSETSYLNSMYCREPEELFDVPAIIHFIQGRSEEFAGRNAMLLLVHYIEENGGCRDNE